MTPAEINENNKLIAEFMGGQYRKGIGWVGIGGYMMGLPYGKAKDILEFNTSWNWLMPVVARINSTEAFDYLIPKNVEFGVKIGKYTVRVLLLDAEHGSEIGDFTTPYGTYGGTEILRATYDTVIDFIKRYNEQKPKK